MSKQLALDGMQVYGESQVGWDKNAHPNETVDESGMLVKEERGFGESDPRSPSHREYDDPEVQRLRAYLLENNGIRNLEICSPSETERAARIFYRDGFVVVRDVLDSDLLAQFRKGCARVLNEILSIPGIEGRKYVTETGRLPHRYSFGTASSSGHQMHDPIWASMVDLSTTTPILRKIFSTDDYLVWGGGGDVCLPGAIEYQHLHADYDDLQQLDEGRLAYARKQGLKLDGKRNFLGYRTKYTDDDDQLSNAELKGVRSFAELDLRVQRVVIDRTPPMVTINFLMSDLTRENGPIRQIPGTHMASQLPPSQKDEPEWMRLSTLSDLSAGAGIFRDNRAWHGGTPNLSREVRALPNIEYAPAWRSQEKFQKSMPHDVWESLTSHGQKLCRYITESPGIRPTGAGVMHPLAYKRSEAFSRSDQS